LPAFTALTKVQSGELVEFDNGLQGIVLNLEEDNVGVVLLGASEGVKEGDTIKRTNKIASVKVGEGMLRPCCKHTGRAY
jgi:F-type H+-transporting ATPase subunit alpha